MTNNDILKASLLDIIFDNRNKQYGAYALRKTYNQRMAYAVAGAIGCTVMLLFVGLHFSEEKIVEQPVSIPKDPVVITDYVEPEPEQPKPAEAKAAPQPPVATKAFTSIIEIVKDDVPIEQAMPPQEALISVAIGTKNTDGDMPAAIQQPPAAEPQGDAPTPAPDSKIYEASMVQQMAEFPGGPGAFQRFLAKHLQTPDDLGAGERKTVQVRFVIQKDGSVLDMSVLRSGGAAFDAEVLRVLKKTPRWKPALQNGQHVAVAFTVPVTFVSSEE